jgi:hypothetical protein
MPFSINTINTAFKPPQEIQDPDHFAGRVNEVQQAVIALGQPGSFLAIWGPRGVGKSSLARQVQLIASGNRELVDKLDLQKYVPGSGFNFLVHYICADTSMQTIDDLARAISLGDNHSPALVSHLKEALSTTEVKSTAVAKGSLLAAGGEISETIVRKPENPISAPAASLKSLLSRLRQEKRSAHTGLLIVIDEFEQINNISGFASLIKTCSDDFVKFCIVGISDDINTMLAEHQSIGRNLVSVGLARMSEPELSAIIERANQDLQPASFSDELKKQIVSTSEGFPYFVQMLGYQCALDALGKSLDLISHANLLTVLEKLKSGTLADIYERMYGEAVKHSEQRELLLKTFADTTGTDLSSTDVYQFVISLGVTNPSQLMPPLTSPDSGEPALVKVAERTYRFKDPLFRTYVRLRNFKFRDN